MADKSAKNAELEKYLGQIAAYDREFKPWVTRVGKILKCYRDERKSDDRGEGTVKFNILWSNVQTLVPATFSRIPKAAVSRRYRDNDPVGRVASLILERAIEYEIEHYPDFRNTTRADVLDRFLGGRGSAWARYEPHVRAKNTQLPVDGLEVTEDADEPQEELDYECAPVDYVHWRDFGHVIARTWEEVPAVWRKVYMQMDAKTERFGKDAEKIPKDAPPRDDKYRTDRSAREDGSGAPADDGSWIYELWDKSKKKAFWFHKNMKDFLDERDDPLGLEEFFPCPKPLYATLTNDSLIPVPDFSLYQDQARSLDTLADRIYGLINMLQVKGVYDATQKEIGRLFTEGGNGNLIPVKNWAAFAEKQGLKGALDIVDLDPIARALQIAYEAFGQNVQFVYQITGIADIVRGVSDPNETLGAQEIKQNFVGLRLGDMKMAVAQFVTELLQLKAQIICTKFDPQTILKIASIEQLTPSDQQLVPQALALLVGPERMTNPDAEAPNPMRSFRIEVNANTLVQIDEQEEKQNRMELITAFSTGLDKSAQVVQAAPQILPLIVEILKYGVTAFPVGKGIEGTFDTLLEQLKQAAANPQPPKPDPEMAKVQAQAQADKERLMHDQQVAQQQAAQEAQIAQREAEANQQKMAMEQKMKEMEAYMEERQQAREQEFERWKAELDASTKITIAEIAAKASLDQALMKAETDANAEVSKDLGGGSSGEPAAPAKPRRPGPLERLHNMHAESMQANQKAAQDLHEKTAQQHGEAMQAITNLAMGLHEAMTKPKRIVRDPKTGKAVGVETVK